MAGSNTGDISEYDLTTVPSIEYAPLSCTASKGVSFVGVNIPLSVLTPYLLANTVPSNLSWILVESAVERCLDDCAQNHNNEE